MFYEDGTVVKTMHNKKKMCARLNEIYFSCVLCLLLFNIVDVTGHKEAAGDRRVSM